MASHQQEVVCFGLAGHLARAPPTSRFRPKSAPFFQTAAALLNLDGAVEQRSREDAKVENKAMLAISPVPLDGFFKRFKPAHAFRKWPFQLNRLELRNQSGLPLPPGVTIPNSCGTCDG
jgi:hypothetical protein